MCTARQTPTLSVSAPAADCLLLLRLRHWCLSRLCSQHASMAIYALLQEANPSCCSLPACFAVRHAPALAAGASSGSDDEAPGSAAAAGEGSASQRFLCFEVMDTGVGVSRQALESLFQDYVQVRGVCVCVCGLWRARYGVLAAFVVGKLAACVALGAAECCLSLLSLLAGSRLAFLPSHPALPRRARTRK